MVKPAWRAGVKGLIKSNLPDVAGESLNLDLLSLDLFLDQFFYISLYVTLRAPDVMQKGHMYFISSSTFYIAHRENASSRVREEKEAPRSHQSRRDWIVAPF